MAAAAPTLARGRTPETKSVGLVELWRDSRRRRFERDVLEGLGGTPKSIPSRYLYDARGVQLERAALEAPDNYLTLAERDVFVRRARLLAAPLRDCPCDVVDLSPGDPVKTRILLERFRGCDVRYVPISSSDATLTEVVQNGLRTLAWLPMFPVRAEPFAGIAHLASLDPSRRRLVLWLGSNVGLLDRSAALTYLRGLRETLRPDERLLVSFDLLKEPSLLESACLDARGANADFHLNVLTRINRELDGHFRASDFRYRAGFCPIRQAMICELVSRRVQSVRVGHFRHEFGALEPIQTQISYKYRQSEISALARRAGFADVQAFTDERRHVHFSLLATAGSA